MKKPCVTLDNWAVIQSAGVGVFQELEPGMVLVGNASGHQRFHESELIYTSRIVRVQQDGNYAETKNTIYRLGRINDDYREWNDQQRSNAAA
jgi:hypothetical protein